MFGLELQSKQAYCAGRVFGLWAGTPEPDSPSFWKSLLYIIKREKIDSAQQSKSRGLEVNCAIYGRLGATFKFPNMEEDTGKLRLMIEAP